MYTGISLNIIRIYDRDEHTLPRLSRLFGTEFFLEFFIGIYIDVGSLKTVPPTYSKNENSLLIIVIIITSSLIIIIIIITSSSLIIVAHL